MPQFLLLGFIKNAMEYGMSELVAVGLLAKVHPKKYGHDFITL